MLQTYGYVLHTIPVDLDLGCPNRSIDGSGGCTFCPENGARAIQTLKADSLKEQISQAIGFATKRYQAKDFMLYIQAYTGTFASVIKQKEIYSKLLREYNFKAISIGTRPDCLSEETLEYLRELNQEIDVFIDLGIQTLNDTTLKKINRGHSSSESLNAIKKLHSYGIKIFAHIIVGFEKESRADWEYTVKTLVKAKIDGIKIHNLHIIENTQLANEYQQKKFQTLNEYEYAEEIIYLLRFIPFHIPILRLCTDTLEESLIAPKWHMSKGEFIRFVTEEMYFRDIRQGDFVEEIDIKESEEDDFSVAEDGSISLWNKKYRSYYHPKSGAYKQARELFIENSNLKKLLKSQNVNLLDIGFGMGYNSLEAMKIKSKNNLYIDALDRDLQVIKKSAKFLQSDILKEIYNAKKYSKNNVSLVLHVGDVRYTITLLKDKVYDVIFLDPFLYTQNTTLITLDILKLICKKLKDNGIIVCSSSIEVVRDVFSQLGYKSEIIDIKGTDIKGIVVKKGEQTLQNILPYRDEYLVYRDKQIIANRDKALASS